MSLYGDYIKELMGKEIVEDSCGFISFFNMKDAIYMEDLYVAPNFRKAGHATHLADKIIAIAKERGFKKVYGSVRPSANGSTDSVKVLLAYGFKIDSAAQDAIAFVKEL